MKKLIRIKLINWHLFSNQTVEINHNALLSGENGAGKSTFLDAIQYILTGGKAKFNNAANQRAKRDLEGYIRCKLGIENKTYLRNQDVTSHIALQFQDELTLKSLVIGVVIEINRSNRINEHFYVLKNCEISDQLFIDNNIIRGYALYKKYLMNEDIEVVFTDTKEKTRQLFLNILGIKDDKYIELIPKALAFRPIEELNKFVFDFLLNEKNVSIDDLRQNVRSYREFENLVETLMEKQSLLSTISKDYDYYKDDIEKQNLISQVIKYTHFRDVVEKEKRMINEIGSIRMAIKKTKELELSLETQLSALDEEIEHLNRALNRNEIYSYYQDLEKKIIDKEKEKVRLIEHVRDLKEIQKHENNLANYVYQNIKIDERLLVKYDLNHELEVKKQIQELIDLYEKLKGELLIEINEIKKEKHTLDEQMNKTKEELYYLEKNQVKFNPQVEKLKSLIEKEIMRITNKNCKVYALCELIEVKDETWRQALEGYLNTQRFDLFVEPIYFDLALNIYEKYKKAERLYGVGLVNTQTLSTYQETNENSLASKIKTQHYHAKFYINMLLNRVICCEKLEDLKKCKTAITKSCMVYKNHCARQIHEDIYKKPYIGIEAVRLQLISNKKMLLSLKEKKEQCLKNISLKEFYLERLKASQLNYLKENIHAIKSLKRIEEELAIEKQKYKKITSSQELSHLQYALKLKKENHKKLEEEKKNCFLKEGKLSSDLENKSHLLNEIQEEKAKCKKVFDSEITKYYEDLNQEYLGKHSKIINVCQDKIKDIEEKIKNTRMNLMTRMNQYNLKYHVGYSPTVDGVDNYLNELNKIKNYELFKYQNQATEARINCEIAFKEQFIYKLRENMMNAHEELNHLNEALKGKKFGGDEYEFIYKANPNHEYERYYHLIMSEEDYEQALFSETISDQNKLVLKELFDKLVIDRNDHEAELALSKFCDYRNYMSYDIKIHHKNGEMTYFSKVNREKSGGETQTPFYVVIAASFEQLIADKKVRTSPACFVMFDEAFNNMDESRIQAMMEFYKQLNIQLMIAVPPQRIETILPHVNTTLVVMKDDDKSFIESFSYLKDN